MEISYSFPFFYFKYFVYFCKKQIMKEIKEILIEVFDYVSAKMIISLFIGSFLLFLFLDESIKIALHDSLFVTIAMLIFVIFGRYIRNFENK